MCTSPESAVNVRLGTAGQWPTISPCSGKALEYQEAKIS